MEISRAVFATSWSRLTWTTTIICLAIALGVAAYILVSGVEQLGHSRSIGMIMVAAAVADVLSILVVAFFAPGQYVVTPVDIVVNRLGPDIRLPLSEVTEVEVVGADVFRGAVRTMASGGLFGFFGRFHSPEVGAFSAYVTRMDKLVLIKRRNANPVVLSPDEQERFVEAVRSALSLEHGKGSG